MKYKILYNPKKIYASMFRDLKKAKKEILIETYIYGKDKVGRKFREILVKKAKGGIKVKLLIDAWGSSVNKKFFRELVEVGGEVRFFRGFRYVIHFFSENHERNHRKLLIVDEKISYIGSINLSSASINGEELVLRLEQDISHFLRKSFFRFWKNFAVRAHWRMKKIVYRGFEIIQDSPKKLFRPSEKSYKRLIKKSKKEILIVTPYFVPSRGMRKVLKAALGREISVKIILPRVSDLKFLDLVRNRYIGGLLKSGAKVYFYPKLIHSKLLIVDDVFLLGSSNLDYRSFRHQFDINLLGKNKKILKELKNHFFNNLKKSKKINYDLWKRRHVFKRVIERLLVPLHKYF